MRLTPQQAPTCLSTAGNEQRRCCVEVCMMYGYVTTLEDECQ
jgi:hypothetical protein